MIYAYDLSLLRINGKKRDIFIQILNTFCFLTGIKFWLRTAKPLIMIPKDDSYITSI